MTSLRARLLAALIPAALLIAFAFVPSPSVAGGDDFEFGQSLAALGTKSGDQAYFELARQVYHGVIADPDRSEADKDLCRYGLAEMTRDEAMGATGNDAVPYKDVVKSFKEAVETMEAFVKKNPEHARAAEARLAVGTTRLGFVQWARDLLGDPDRAKERGTTLTEIKQDAESMVRGAIEYFDTLRKGSDRRDATQVQQISQYYWVLCQYYLALVYEPSTVAATDGLENAAKKLDEFITMNDGQLLAIYAQDIFGLTRWEQARQTSDEEKRAAFYRQAVEWFETCIETEVTDADSQKVVANGYFHLGQVCNEAGRVGQFNFHRMGVDYMEHIEERHPTLWRQDNGIRAMLEWAKLENKRDRKDEAIAIANRAGDYAKKLGKAWLGNMANRILRTIIAGEGGNMGSGSTSASPDVLLRVGNDFFFSKEYGKSIAAYEQVLSAVERRPDNVEEFIVPAWERISSSYREQGDLMASAMALEPLHDIWMDGLVKKIGGRDDPNMIRFGDIRRRAMAIWKTLYDMTGASLFINQHNEIRDSFSEDYPDHPSGGIGDWNAAMEKFREAADQKRDNNARWRATMNETDELLKKVAEDPNSPKQDAAWFYLAYTQYLREDWNGMLKAAASAEKFWNSPEAAKQIEKFPTILARRKPEVGKTLYWKAEAQYHLASDADDAGKTAEAGKLWDALMKTLDGWHVEYEMLRSQERYWAGTLGHLVFAYIGKGDIPGADKAFRRLLQEDPKNSRLPKITFRLAKHFNDKARTIDDERTTARIELNGTKDKIGVRTQLRTTAKQEQIKLEFMVDQRGALQKAKDLVQKYDAKVKEGEDPQIPQKDYEQAKQDTPVLEAKIEELSAEVNKLGAERETLEKRAAELLEVIKSKAQELYEPLTQAADYFWEWDRVLRENNLPRDAGNVAIFADLYFKAGLLRPEVGQNWERAQVLYESYLTLAGVAEEDRQEAMGRLGTIYSRLARTAEAGSEARAKLVQKALDRLQGSIALIPENNDMVVGLLKGDVVVIPWRFDRTNTWYYFPMPRVSTAAEFRKVIAEMGKPGGTPMPKQESEIEDRKYEAAVRAFQNQIGGMNEAAVARTVKGFEGAGFDMRLYKRLAESSDGFRLALAWIYMESGDVEQMNKAYNLASSLVSGTYGAEEYSEDWWEAQALRLGALVTGAELYAREMAAGGKPPVTAVEWATRASNMLRGLHTTNPDLGDHERPETRGELKALFARLKLVCGKVGLSTIDDLILDKLPGGPGSTFPPKDDNK